MKDRSFYLNSFVQKHHLKELTWLSSDASNRRYARVKKGKKSYILMDSPLSEKPKEFIKIDKLLRKHKLNAPKIYAKNLRYGFMLLEDFGSTPLSQAVHDQSKAHDFYTLALDTLVHLQKCVKENPKLPLAYTQMFQENQFFIEYYVPHILQIQLSQKEVFESYWLKSAPSLAAALHASTMSLVTQVSLSL